MFLSYDTQRWKRNLVSYANSKGLDLCCLHMTQDSFWMRIRAVWSEHSLFVDIYYSIHWFCKRTTKAQISLRECKGWSWPALSANCIRAHFRVLRVIYINICREYNVQCMHHTNAILFVLRFYGPVYPKGSCRARSVYLATRLLGRLSLLSG